MLSDREREALREVQRQLASEDPRFARSFDTTPRGSEFTISWPRDVPRWVYTTGIAIAVTLAVMMLVARAAGFALLFAALATLIWLARSYRDETDYSDNHAR